ncbi:MAG: hypothetical protein HZA32_01970 [Opitutae bacterium]|nr:hypothetical protein [Opitutae bacterium]
MCERISLPLLSSKSSAPSSRAFARCSLASIVALCAAASAMRAWLQFSTPLAPGMNGAYYFVQARALLEHGRLGIPDLPLTFWLQAGLARLVAAITGWPLDDAIVFAVKLADSVLPPMAALPIAWLAARWQRADGQPSLVAALAPAALVCASAAPLSMTGDFQKNSLALVWLAGTAWAAHRFLSGPTLVRAAALVGGLALLGTTHVGVLGAALVFLAVLGAVAAVAAPAEVRRRLLLAALVGLVALAGAAAVTYRYDPARVQRLWRAIAEPSSVLSESRDRGDHPPGPPPGFAPPDFAAGTAPVDHPRPPPGFGPPGAPRGILGTLPRVLFLGVGIAATAWALRRWSSLPVADRALAIAAGVSAAVLGGGFFDAQKSERLMLIAVVPAAIAGSFLLAQVRRDLPRATLGIVVVFLAVLSGALYVARGGRQILTVEQRDELRTLAPLIASPERTLIVAHHGLEWWTAWTLRTHIAQPTAVSREDWQRYDHIYYLSEKSGVPRGRGGPPGAIGAPGSGPPPGMGPEGATPENAVTVHDGPLFTLSRVDEAPEDQPTDAEVQAQRLKRQ